MGASLPTALAVSSGFLAFAVPAVIYLAGVRLVRSRAAAFLAVFRVVEVLVLDRIDKRHGSAPNHGRHAVGEQRLLHHQDTRRTGTAHKLVR